MVFSITEVLERLNSGIPFFSHGERHMDEVLAQHDAFTADGIEQQWRMHEQLKITVLDSLYKRYPSLGERERSICCELQMCHLREKIKRNVKRYECYRSLTQRPGLSGTQQVG